jgi:hypothetical protein
MTAAPLVVVRCDNSPVMLALDELELAAEHDRRRRPEMVGALARLNALQAVYSVTELAGVAWVMPTARLLALRDALRIRARLNLPTMEPPDV